MAAMNESDSGAASGASERLIRAVRHVLHPLVRLLLAQGLTYPWLSDMLKGIFVDVADRDFQLAGKRQTDSRVSLLTGVHRKDVRRLRDEDGDRSSRMPPAVSLGSQLVARWVTTPRYLDEEGMPIPLARLASQGGELSFEALVATVSKDIRARAVLDEWMRLGVALLDADDRVILNSEAFVPARGFDEKVFYFGQNVHDHVSTAVDNVIGVEPADIATVLASYAPAVLTADTLVTNHGYADGNWSANLFGDRYDRCLFRQLYLHRHGRCDGGKHAAILQYFRGNIGMSGGDDYLYWPLGHKWI